ncbi:MAG: DUF3662 domain-containing protein [Coriobacteriia bacterium]|nr:DUF3662 domain-containing protein [Coriobacteriia bacterium]
MSLLSEFEDRVGRAVEGGFARVFRSPVQPAEIAKAAGKEVERGRKVGVGKVYAPTLYSVLLSPEDDDNLGGFAETLAGELETYLVGYARERSYTFAVRPVVRFIVDPELKLGRFEVIGELLSPEELAEELGDDYADEPVEAQGVAASAASIGAGGAGAAASAAEEAALEELAELGRLGTPGRKPSIPVVRPALFFDAEVEDSDATGTRAGHIATVTVRGIDHDVVLRGDRMLVGRLGSCDVCLQDHNTSRQHAAFVRTDDGWAVEDLGSTNGTVVNGAHIDRIVLRDGDVIVVGITELVYHGPRG